MLAPGVAVTHARQWRVACKAIELDELIVSPLAHLVGACADGREPVSLRIHGARVQDSGASAIGSDQGGENHRSRPIEHNDHRMRIRRGNRYYTRDSMRSE